MRSKPAVYHFRWPRSTGHKYCSPFRTHVKIRVSTLGVELSAYGGTARIALGWHQLILQLAPDLAAHMRAGK